MFALITYASEDSGEVHTFKIDSGVASTHINDPRLPHSGWIEMPDMPAELTIHFDSLTEWLLENKIELL